MSQWLVGLDLGKKSDYTALVIAEQTDATPCIYNVKKIHRYPLETGYPHIVRDVSQLMRKPGLADAKLIVDETGCGTAVVDMFRESIPDPLVAVWITAGHVTTWNESGRDWHVPKRELVSVVQSLIGPRRIVVEKTEVLAAELVTELKNFKMKVTEAENLTFDTFRDSEKDDVVLALALLAWYGEKVNKFNICSIETLADRVAAAQDLTPIYPQIRFFRPHKTWQPMPKIGGRIVEGCEGFDTQEEAAAFVLEIQKLAGEKAAFSANDKMVEATPRVATKARKLAEQRFLLKR